jgi:hypothetical protein
MKAPNLYVWSAAAPKRYESKLLKNAVLQLLQW